MAAESNNNLIDILMIIVTLVGVIIIPILAGLIKVLVSQSKSHSDVEKLKSDMEKDEEALEGLNSKVSKIETTQNAFAVDMERTESRLNSKIDAKMLEIMKNQSDTQNALTRIDGKLAASLEVLQKIVENHESQLIKHGEEIRFFNKNIQDFYEKYDLKLK